MMLRASTERSVLAGRYEFRCDSASADGEDEEAVDLVLGRPIHIRWARTPRGIAALQQLGNLLARIEHEALPLEHDRGTEGDECTWLVLRPRRGESFEKLCAASSLDLMASLGVLLRVAAGMVHLHRRGLAWGAAMPNAIHVASDGSVSLDIRSAHAEASSGTLAQDRVAFGALVDFVLERAPERTGERRVRRELAHVRDAARRLDGPYADTTELLADLEAVRDGRVVRAHAPTPWTSCVDWVARHPGRAATVALLSIAVIASAWTFTSVQARANRRVGHATRELSAREAEAEAARETAELARRAADALGDHIALDRLLVSAESLWPAVTQDTSRYDSWLAAVAELDARAEVRHRLARDLEAALAAGTFGAALSRERLGWLGTELAAVDRRVSEVVEGEATRVRARRAEVAALVERSALSEGARAAWAAALADLDAEARARSSAPLLDRSIVGLSPLGRDPRSGLHEFAHLPTGLAPVRDPATGALVRTPETGIILVLLPGGTFAMGAVADDPLAPNHARDARRDEAPVHAVTLAPFLISKYEVAVAQWARLADPGAAQGAGPMHPAISLSWTDAMTVVARGGLALPSEAQWEYAARAGTRTPWWSGSDPWSVRALGNVRDQSHNVFDGDPWDDGHMWMAPVGSFEPNPFGLHDTIGNAMELCRDRQAPYAFPTRGPDGERLAGPSRLRAARGGSIFVRSESCRTSSRLGRPEGYRHLAQTARPVLARH